MEHQGTGAGHEAAHRSCASCRQHSGSQERPPCQTCWDVANGLEDKMETRGLIRRSPQQRRRNSTREGGGCERTLPDSRSLSRRTLWHWSVTSRDPDRKGINHLAPGCESGAALGLRASGKGPPHFTAGETH